MKGKIFSILFTLMLVLSMSLVSAAPVAAAATINVPGDYLTIQAAINAASDGDTINVAAGTYTNDIWDSLLGTPAGYRITKSITLLGAQAGNDPAGSTDRGGESILVRTNGLPYSLYASDITIDGFMIGSSDPNTGGRLIISDVADNAIIKNCIIQNAPDKWAGHGVYIYPGAENALVEYNTFYNTAWEAIASWQVSNAVISHNYISSSGQHAIQMMGHAGSNNEITYNHISGIVGKNAIQYWGGPGAIISHNVIDGGNTMFDGIWLDTAADGSTVSNNQVFDTVYAGINVRGGCTNATVTYNDVSGCGTGIDVVGTVTGIGINFNGIYGNLMGVANYYSNDVIDATNNWWGHASGPSGEAGRTSNKGKVIGKGDAVSANVDWDSWLPQPIGHTPHHPVPPGLLK
jgi:parallel beta-helix repeat protein